MARTEKTKLPRHLGGFKLAKALRKAEPIEELLTSLPGRALLADAIAAAGTAAIAALQEEAEAEPPEQVSRPRTARAARKAPEPSAAAEPDAAPRRRRGAAKVAEAV